MTKIGDGLIMIGKKLFKFSNYSFSNLQSAPRSAPNGLKGNAKRNGDNCFISVRKGEDHSLEKEGKTQVVAKMVYFNLQLRNEENCQIFLFHEKQHIEN
jgi:hypothetical protein